MPEGTFCANCGAHQGVDVADAQGRPQHFAVAPGEHVAQPSMFTTLFPHLGHAKVHEFRYAFLIGLAIIVVLVATGLVLAALLASIFLIPLLYLIYLYEAQVYRQEPALVIGVTFVGGIALGLAVTIIANAIIGQKSADDPGVLIGSTVILPIIQLIVIPIPALLLRGRAGFAETVDGLVFGVTAGLGFSIAEGIVRFSSIFGSLGIHTDSAGWIYPLVALAVLVPVLHGSTGGAIAAALWRSRKRGGRASSLALFGIPAALLAGIAFYLVAQVLANQGASPLIVLLYQAVPVALLLTYIRFLLHHALLEESRDFGFQPVVCPNCQRHVMAAGFCPNCGAAMTATPRRQGASKAGKTASTEGA